MAGCGWKGAPDEVDNAYLEALCAGSNWTEQTSKTFERTVAASLPEAPVHIGEGAWITLGGHRPRRVEHPARRVPQGHSIRLRTVAIFCVTLRRAVFEEVGELCEEYSRGFFEDERLLPQGRGRRIRRGALGRHQSPRARAQSGDLGRRTPLTSTSCLRLPDQRHERIELDALEARHAQRVTALGRRRVNVQFVDELLHQPDHPG